MAKSQLEREFATRWRQLAPDAPKPVREYHFTRPLIGDPPRPPARPNFRKRMKAAGLSDWMFDFAWGDSLVAVEIEGATWANGRHTRGSGYREDCQKYNLAARIGWRVFRITSGMLREDAPAIIEMVKEAL